MRFLQALGLAFVLIILIAVTAAVEAPAPRHRNTVYFPINALSSNPDADAAMDLWLEKTLQSMRNPAQPRVPTQPSLWQPLPETKDQENYRVIISSGRDYVMAIRVYSSPLGTFVTANEADFQKTGENRARSRALTHDEWESVTDAFEASRFRIASPTPPAYPGDCLSYVIESRRGEVYHSVSLACPASGQFKPIMELFPKLVGWFPN